MFPLQIFQQLQPLLNRDAVMNYLAQSLDQRGYVPVAEDKPAICNPCSPCVHNISGHLQIFLYGFTLQSACNGDAGRNRLDHFGKTVQVTGIVGLDQIYSEFRAARAA